MIMKITNYDRAAEKNNFTQLYPFMPSDTFRMLIFVALVVVEKPIL